MSPFLPFDIFTLLIINIIPQNRDTNLLKELAVVSHSFLQICSKHRFATVEVHEPDPRNYTTSINGFVKLLKSRPDSYFVKHIRKLPLFASSLAFMKAEPTFTNRVVGRDFLCERHYRVGLAPFSANTIHHIPTTTTCSYPSFQIPSEQFLKSLVS